MRLTEAMNAWTPEQRIQLPSLAEPGTFKHFMVGTRQARSGAYRVLTDQTGQMLRVICLEFMEREDFELVPRIPPLGWTKLAEIRFAPKTLRAIMNSLTNCLYLGGYSQCCNMRETPQTFFWIEQAESLRRPSGDPYAKRDVQWYLDTIAETAYPYRAHYLVIDAQVAGNENVLIYERCQ